jgi:hypothetical protein
MKRTNDINFLSTEDLALADLSEQELDAAWEAWFELAQASNAEDADYYSHACFGHYPPIALTPPTPSSSRQR